MLALAIVAGTFISGFLLSFFLLRKSVERAVDYYHGL
jgi:hypothetical protein